MKAIKLIILSLLVCAAANAQTVVEHSTAVAVGSMDRLDTYLSPLHYEGTDVRFVGSDLMITKGRFDHNFTYSVGVDYTKNPAENAHTLAGHVDFTYAMMAKWTLLDDNLTLRIGPAVDLYGGFAYNMRNASNNPAQGYASANIGAEGMAQYLLPWKLCHRQIRISYDARLNLAGAMFSPAYGQSYYEMFVRGDYDHNIVFTSVATPDFRQQLTVDLPVGKHKAIRVGYLNDIRQATPNNLKQHVYTHAALIGVVF